MGDCFKSTGKIVDEYRAVQQFNEIQVMNNINLFITYDTIQEIRVEAGKNLVNLIKTDVNNNRLIIKNNNKCNWIRS